MTANEAFIFKPKILANRDASARSTKCLNDTRTMSNSSFTFCIPNLNKFKYLPACIESMLAQDDKNWCCVFVDGYSTDGSWEYMQQFACDPRFLLLRGLKKGMYADWNECLRHVKTEYFYFLPSDDTCFPSLVSTTVTALDHYQDIAACHFQYAMIDASGEIIQSPEEIMISQQLTLYKEINYKMHRRSGICEFIMQIVYCAPYTSMTSLVFRSSLIDKLQGINTTYGSHGDFDWTMRLTLLTDILYVPKLLATWRICEGQASQQTSSVKFTESMLALASDNLEAFMRSDKYYFEPPINLYQLLSDYLDSYLHGTYMQIFQDKDLTIGLIKLLRFAAIYPLFFPRKILRKISFNRIFPRIDKTARAQILIRKHDLFWPPTEL